MKRRKYYYLYIFLIAICIASCNKDDDQPSMDPCRGIEQIPEVTVLFTVIAVDNDSQRGYLVEGTATNNTDERIDGQIELIWIGNGTVHGYGGPAVCGPLDGGEVCEFEYFDEETERPDFDVEAACARFIIEQ